jgi:hypothetical protein
LKTTSIDQKRILDTTARFLVPARRGQKPQENILIGYRHPALLRALPSSSFFFLFLSPPAAED